MNERVKEKCELLADNFLLISKEFKWELEMMSIIAASIYTNAGLKADPAKMRECLGILKKKKGLFSDLRGTAELALLSKMAISNAPENYLDEVIGVYDKVTKGHIFTSAFMVQSAMLICDRHLVGKADEIIKKTEKIMKKMNKEHPILTGSEDLPLATIMAMLPGDPDALVEEMENCYELLKKEFPMHKNAVQGLCQVLTMSSQAAEDKCGKVMAIFNALKERKDKFGKDTEIAALGSLVDLDMDAAAIADEIGEASRLLKEHKGFGNFRLGKEYRAMFAAFEVADVFGGEQKPDSSILGSSIAVVIAEEIMIALIAASTAAAASSSTN